MSLKNVALIGANGTLGPAVLSALRASNLHTYVLNRSSSKSAYPEDDVLLIPDNLSVDQLTLLFRKNNIDALVITIAGSRVEEQKKLIEAAFHGGVKRVIPAEFGSCDSADDETVALLPLMEGKKRIRAYLQDLAKKEREGMERLTWTAIVTGHFFDHGLETSLLKFDVRGRKAYIIDGGDIYFSATNLHQIGEAVVSVLQRPDETANELLYIHSFSVTQNEVLAALEEATGGEKWESIHQSSKDEIKHARPKMMKGDAEATEEVVAVHGLVASDWRGKGGFANELLQLKGEILVGTVKKVVSDLEQ